MSTVVYGLGESGIAATRTLLARGEHLRAVDAGDDPRLRATLEELKELGVEGALGVGPEVLKGADLLVVSPGIRPRDAVLRAAALRGVPVISEVALGLELLGSGVRVAAITGTNGKTTVVDMLHRMLGGAGVPHAVAGNSWRALTGCLHEARATGLVVLEVSSFQLHYMSNPGFDVAALLNARPDHLNWHTSFEEYARDKLRIFEGQGPDDLALVNAEDPLGLEMVHSLAAEVLVVGEGDTAVRDGRLLLRGREIASEGELRLAGTHNLTNALFAAAVAERLQAKAAPHGGRGRAGGRALRGRLQSDQPGGGRGGAGKFRGAGGAHPRRFREGDGFLRDTAVSRPLSRDSLPGRVRSGDLREPAGCRMGGRLPAGCGPEGGRG